MTPADAKPFSKRTVAWLAWLGGISLVSSIVVGVATTRPPATRVGSDSTNPSAFGHSAFVELLRDVGVPVVVARARTAERTKNASLLLLIEPHVGRDGRASEDLAGMIERAECPVVVVLPKWSVVERTTDSGTESVGMRRERHEVERVLRAVDRRAEVAQAIDPVFTSNAFDAAPRTQRDCQLVAAARGGALVQASAGALVWESPEPRSVAVLADPDVVANHGLHRGDNARLALAIVARFRSGSGPVIVDETLHGLGTSDSFWTRVFRFPLVLAPLQAFLAAGLLVLSGAFRFGAPAPPQPPYPPGKRFLIRHVAHLLESGGHHAAAAGSYLTLAREDLERRQAGAHARPALDAIENEIRHLEARRPRDPRAATTLARRLWRIRQENSNGPR